MAAGVRNTTHAILLCGGKGMRLRNVTHDQLPKSLVKVAGKELIQYTIESLPRNIETIIFAVGHQDKTIKEWLNNVNLPFNTLVSEPNLQGMSSAIGEVLPRIGETSVLVANTDEIRVHADIERLTEYHKRSRLAGTVLGVPADQLYRHRVLEMSPEQRVESSILKGKVFEDNPHQWGIVNGGVFICTMKSLRDMPLGTTSLTPLDMLINQKQLKVNVQPEVVYFNVGTPKEFAEAEAYLTQNT